MRKFLVTVNDASYEVVVEEIGGVAPVAVSGAAAPVAAAPASVAPPAPAPEAKPAASAAGETVSAPMPGTILAVNVQRGERVKSGDVLMILEAMKMENEILAPRDGKVAQIAVGKGTAVNTGDLLAVLE